MALLPLVLGCQFDASGGGSGSETAGLASAGSASAGSASTESASTGSISGSGTTTALDGSSSAAPGSSDGTSAPATDTGSTGEPPQSSYSCADVLAADPSATTGIHTILRASDDARIDVWCEMTLEGGGWTLVGRSAMGPQVPFGWGVSRGTLGDEASPYSLDAIEAQLPFSQILVGTSEGFATLIEHAYVIDVPAGFLEAYGDAAYEHDGADAVIGGCMPPEGPAMLGFVGYTDDQSAFFFRDNADAMTYGLFSNRMWTLYDDCNQGGMLDGTQAALFVR